MATQPTQPTEPSETSDESRRCRCGRELRAAATDSGEPTCIGCDRTEGDCACGPTD